MVNDESVKYSSNPIKTEIKKFFLKEPIKIVEKLSVNYDTSVVLNLGDNDHESGKISH